MKITVLGKSPAWQDANGACSGYLVQEDGLTLLLDCGNGVFGKLREYSDFRAVDAVVLSHLHADHFLDLIPFAYALTYGPPPPGPAPAPPQLHGPPDTARTLRQVTGAWNAPQLVEDAFAVTEYSPDSVLEIGPLRFRFHLVPHYVPAWAVEITSTVTGGRFTFGADCAPNSALVDFARDTDLLFIEAAITDPDEGGMRGHLTPLEAGQHGRDAGARRLVITHFGDLVSPAWVREQAEDGFGKPVTLAHEGAVFTL